MLSKVLLSVVSLLAVFSLANGEHATYSDKEVKYLEEVRSHGNGTIFSRDNQNLLALGNYTCRLLDDKTTPNTVIELVVAAGDLGADPEAMGNIITDAVVNICPKHKQLLEVG